MKVTQFECQPPGETRPFATLSLKFKKMRQNEVSGVSKEILLYLMALVYPFLHTYPNAYRIVYYYIFLSDGVFVGVTWAKLRAMRL